MSRMMSLNMADSSKVNDNYARTGALLWKTNLGGQIVMAPVTFQVEGKQYVSVIAGSAMFTFGLRDN